MNGTGGVKNLAPHGETNITVKTERSLRTKVLQSSIKPFGTQLVKPGKPTPAGSPELRAPEVVFDFCNVRQRVISGIRIYDINPRSLSTRENFIPAQIADLKTELEPVRTTTTFTSGHALRQIQTHEEQNIRSFDFAKPAGKAKRKLIYYFAGGGFQSPASAEHWKFLAHICHQLNDKRDVPTTISLVSYPLAPNNPARSSLKALEVLYRALLPQTPPSTPVPGAAHPVVENMAKLTLNRTHTTYLVPDEDIIFMGDSAGANVLLSLTLKVLKDDPRARPPSAIFVISPPVDMRNINPEMKAVDKTDPILSFNFVNDVAKTWCGKDIDPADPLVSPLLADLSILAKRRIFLHGVIGGNDVLAPDAKLFMEKCRDQGVKGDWLVWEKQMHCFPLAFSYKVLPEANEAVQWIVDVLERTVPSSS